MMPVEALEITFFRHVDRKFRNLSGNYLNLINLRRLHVLSPFYKF